MDIARRPGGRSLAAAMSMVFTVAVFANMVSAQDEPEVATILGSALDYYYDVELEKGIDVANGLLTRADLRPADSIAVYELLSVLTFAQGEEFFKQSVGYLEKIARVGPCVNQLPQDFWPSKLCNHWYDIKKARDVLVCPSEREGGLKTIAFMPFDNHSIGEYQEKLKHFGSAMAEFFTIDFMKLGSLRIVERTKLDYLLKEIQLSQTGTIDQATALKIGKMLGAHLMVFGSITQIDRGSTMVAIRVVNVETSELIVALSKDGKPNYGKIEKELIQELVEALEIELDSKTKDLLKHGGTDSFDATHFYALGLDYMNQYNYAEAYKNFKKAHELDADFAVAKRKMEIYKPLVDKTL